MTPDLSKWSVKIVAKKILYLSFACQVLFPIYYHANLVTERNIICLQKEILCENCEQFHTGLANQDKETIFFVANHAAFF